MTRAPFLLPTLLSAAVFGQSDTLKRLDSAVEAFNEVMYIKEKSIPRDLLKKAECAVIVPGLKKGAFIFGAQYGRGFVSCRGKSRAWSAPGAVRVEGGSFGLQIGGSETDVFMLVMNESGVKRLMSSRFTLGGDASVAAGPVGRTAEAKTDAYMRAEILTWSRSRGVFAGVSLQGATLREDNDAIEDLYGKQLRNRDIVQGSVPVPKAAAALIAALSKHSGGR